MTLMQTVVQWVGLGVLVLAGVFCLACGLYNAAEWLEDHVKTSYRFIKRATIWCISVQTAWLLIDRTAHVPNAVGLLSHLTSCLLLRHHPHHQNSLMLTAAAVLLLVAHQTSWIYWWFQRAGSPWQAVSILASLVWPVPTMLLLSSASSDTLPVAMSPLPAGAGKAAGSLKSPLGSLGSPSQSPTAAAAAAAARGDVVSGAADAVAGLKRQIVKNATAHWHQKPLLPESSDVKRYREQDQSERARVLALMRSSSGGAELEQQLLGQKQHKSMVVRGLDALKHHIRPMLPVRDSDAGSSRIEGLMSKIIKD